MRELGCGEGRRLELYKLCCFVTESLFFPSSEVKNVAIYAFKQGKRKDSIPFYLLGQLSTDSNINSVSSELKKDGSPIFYK